MRNGLGPSAAAAWAELVNHSLSVDSTARRAKKIAGCVDNNG